MAVSYLCLIAAAVIYVIGGIGIVRSMSASEAKENRTFGALALLGFAVHGVGIATHLFATTPVTFGFGMALSITFWIAVGVFLVESFVRRVSALMGIFLLLTAIATVMPVVFPGDTVDSALWTPLFKVHLMLALAASSFMVIAFVQAILLVLVDKQLKDPVSAQKTTGLIANLPSLLAMERILYRIVACGFVCLTLLLVVGAINNAQDWSTVLFSHKTLFTVASWVVFAILMVGHYVLGWRSKKALMWFWAGFGTLIVAYFIYSLVRELFGL